MHVVDRGLVFDATQAEAVRRFCTFTSIVRLYNGKLLVSFRTGSAKDSADENVMIVGSDDEGKTWRRVSGGWETGYPPGSGWRFRALGLSEPVPGRLLGLGMAVNRAGPPRPFANPQTQGILPQKVMVSVSHDEGRTWAPFEEVDLRPHRGNATTGDILTLKDGTLALPYEAWKEYDDASPGEHHASLRLSADGGQTWPDLSIVVHDPTGRLLFWDQRLSVSPDDGRLIALFWTHDRQAQQDVPMHVAWGSPDGREWTQPISTGLEGQICMPLALPGRRVLGAYVHRHDPPSLRAVLSNDFGRTWEVADELVFYCKARGGGESGMAGKRDFADYWADMSVWTFGHPAATPLPHGDVMIVYYAGDEQAMGVHWVRVAID